MLISCNVKTEITGNWSFCDNSEYNEVYINDKTFMFYSDDIGFTIMIYVLQSSDSIFLFDVNKELKLSGKITKLEEGYFILNFTVNESNENLVFELRRFYGDYPVSDSSNLEYFYEWLNKEFIPEFEKRKSNYKCCESKIKQCPRSEEAFSLK